MSDLSIVISGADIAYMEKESDPYLEDWVVNGYQYDLKLLENFHQIQEDILKMCIRDRGKIMECKICQFLLNYITISQGGKWL